MFNAMFNFIYRKYRKALPAVGSLTDIQAVINLLEYRYQLIDWQPEPEIAYGMGYMDCNGFAGLTGKLLEQLHPEWSHTLNVICKDRSQSHSVRVFKDSKLTGAFIYIWSNKLMRTTELINTDDVKSIVGRIRPLITVKNWKLI